MARIHPDMSYEGSKITPQDMTFEGTLNLYDGEREIRIIDMGPGHSPSDVIIYLPKEKVLFAGDLLAVTTNPPPFQIWSGSYRVIKVLDTLASMDVETFVPGHGRVVLNREETVKMVIGFIEFYMVLREEARKCFERGMTYGEAFEKLDWSKFKKWGEKEGLRVIRGNLARAWSEFRGEPPGTKIEYEW
jgi:cyclase